MTWPEKDGWKERDVERRKAGKKYNGSSGERMKGMDVCNFSSDFPVNFGRGNRIEVQFVYEQRYSLGFVAGVFYSRPLSKVNAKSSS